MENTYWRQITLFPPFGMFQSANVFPLHVLLLWPILPHLLQTTDFDYLGSLNMLVDSSFLLFLAFFGLPRALLITGGSITGVCKGGHKFDPLHGWTINEYVVNTVDFLSNATTKHIQFKTIIAKQQEHECMELQKTTPVIRNDTKFRFGTIDPHACYWMSAWNSS